MARIRHRSRLATGIGRSSGRRTQDWVTGKTKKGFEVSFSEAAPPGAKLDWQLIR